jgi:hypothetical protein
VQGVFYQGQIFDACAFAANLVKTAKRSLVLMDNYVDESVLLLLAKRPSGVAARIYTGKLSRQLQLDFARHNAQYEPVTITQSSAFHDRFLLVDDTVYHIGARVFIGRSARVPCAEPSNDSCRTKLRRNCSANHCSFGNALVGGLDAFAHVVLRRTPEIFVVR